jgi:outer membrane protein insertion porin family
VAAIEVQGALIDRAEDLVAYAETVVVPGSPFVEEGPADAFGTPIGSLPSLKEAFETLGYDCTLAVVPAAPGNDGVARKTLRATLRPYDRLRYVYVRGNGTLRQDEIQRRISIRPGQALPMAGPGREAAMEVERQRVIDFLRSEGYYDANAAIEVEVGRGLPAPVDLTVHIYKGKGFPLGTLNVTGNHELPTDQVDQHFRHADGWKLWTVPAPFTRAQLRTDVDALVKDYRDRGFYGARVTQDFDLMRSVDHDAKKVSLSLVIRERKHVTVVFEGNDALSDSSLEDELSMKSRGSYDDYEVQASAEAIERAYQQRGYFFVRVDWRRDSSSPREERVTFLIDEGPELKVREVAFVGNNAFSHDKLADVVTVRPFPWLGHFGLGEGGYVTGRQLELDRQRLVDFYKGQGFLDVSVRADAATDPLALGAVGAVAAAAETSSRSARDIYVRFSIEEGPRVRLGGIGFKVKGGDPLLFDEAFLRENLTQKEGTPYLVDGVRDDGRRLERLLGEAGYADPQVEPAVDRQGDVMNLTWELAPGPRVRVGPVFVRGNFKTTADTILEQIPLREGDWLTTTALERGQRNLSYLQLFNNASPISFPGRDRKRAVVPMVVQVEERYDQFEVVHLGGGASTEQKPPDSNLPFGFYLRAGYDNRNLLGHGWNLSASYSHGTALKRATATFLDRRFFGTFFRYDVTFNYLQQDTARLGDIRAWAVSTGFSRELYPGVDAGLHYNLRRTTHTEPLLRGAGAVASTPDVTVGTPVGSVSFSLEWQRLDNRLLPSRGFKVTGNVELAPRQVSLGWADSGFIKAGLHGLAVIPLSSKLSLRYGVRYDQGFPLEGEPLIPKVERYFAGGDTTIRGYDLDRARVQEIRYPYPGGLTSVQYRPLGGNIRLLQNIDLQFPISPPIYGAVFIDTGVVTDSLDELSLRDFRHGAGIAPLQIKFPVGDISLAWAWPLDPQPGDSKIGRFLVNIGLLF